MSNWFSNTGTNALSTNTTIPNATGSQLQQLQQYASNLGTAGLGNYYPAAGYYNPSPFIPPTLPIKLGMKELIKLAQIMDTDPELHDIIKKFSPFIGVDV